MSDMLPEWIEDTKKIIQMTKDAMVKYPSKSLSASLHSFEKRLVRLESIKLSEEMAIHD